MKGYLNKQRIYEDKKHAETGITLIALVVTIVILLILTGITITLMLGENGVIHRANLAKGQYKIQEIKERIELNVAAYEVHLREKTLYSFLTQIENLQSINPDNEIEGPPYIYHQKISL